MADFMSPSGAMPRRPQDGATVDLAVADGMLGEVRAPQFVGPGCGEMAATSPVVNPFAVTDNTISSILVRQKLPLVSRGRLDLDRADPGEHGLGPLIEQPVGADQLDYDPYL